MYKCWERYGKKWMKPKIVEQDIRVFVRNQKVVETNDDEEHMMIFIPFIKISQHEGLPILMEGSHRKRNKDVKPKTYSPVIQPGQALMFDARLTCRIPQAGGGVLLGRVYDVTGM